MLNVRCSYRSMNTASLRYFSELLPFLRKCLLFAVGVGQEKLEMIRALRYNEDDDRVLMNNHSITYDTVLILKAMGKR